MFALATRTRLWTSLHTLCLNTSSPALTLCRNVPLQTLIPRRLKHQGTRKRVLDESNIPALRRRRTTLCLSGLPPETTEDDISEFFRQFGDIRDCMVARNSQGNLTGDAFVEFFLPDHATNALEAHIREPIVVGGRKVGLEFIKLSLTTVKPSRTIHISEIPADFPLEDVRAMFEEFGTVYNVRPGRHAGSAYVDFTSTEAGQRAVEAHTTQPFKILRRNVTVFYASPSFTPAHQRRSEEHETRRRLNPPSATVFATKFARPMLERDVRKAFREFGRVEDVVLNYYEDRPSRTMAFVTFSSVEEATGAIEAWQNGELRYLGQSLRMDYNIDPTLAGNAPFHTLRLSGFTGDSAVLESIAEEFKESLWRHSELETDHGRRGKASSVAYLEFITTEHAVAAHSALHGRTINGERLTAAFARPMKAWTLRGGVARRDHGGGKFSFGLRGAGTRRDAGAGVFKEHERRDQWARLERISRYLGDGWRPSGEEEAKRVVGELVRRRAEGKKEGGGAGEALQLVQGREVKS